MAGADRVEPAAFRNLDAPLLCPVVGAGAQAAVVMMDTAAAQFERQAIQQEPMSRVEGDGADTEGRLLLVNVVTVYVTMLTR